MQGRLHSTESFGAVDGPGIRTVFFLQGCPARCAYCHNPDTWATEGGTFVTIDEIVHRAKRGMPYYADDGGVTFSGGEPLLQGEFVAEAEKALNEVGIGSAIDTSGTYIDEFTEEAVRQSEVILLDVKHTDAKIFHELTGRDQDTLFDLIRMINRLGKHVWIRQVIVPGFNDTEEYIKGLNVFLGRVRHIDKVELLPYHNLGEVKYEKLGIDYKLKGTKPLDPKKLEELSEITFTP